jgi:Ca2+-binding RTX toxin-like protein
VGGTAQATLTVMTTRGQLIVGAPGAALSGGNGTQVLDGSLGHQTLDGGSGSDVLIGGDGDTLTGGQGADTFVFRAGFGHETITDFDPQRELIQFENGLFASADDVLQHVASDGQGGSIITFDAADSIVLSGVALAQLHAHEFLVG